MKLRIVLVEPREAGNVGAVARAMKNFGFAELWIVGEHPPLSPLAGWWASGADDVVDGARFAESLYHAVRDAKLTVATTSARGRTTAADLTPRTLAALARTLADDDVLALVFGREDSGLTREELVQCQRSASIPTSEGFPTMNLAQSVCVFCYELSAVERGGAARERAPAEVVERLHDRAAALLLEVGFLQENNPERIYDDLRAMAGRADLDAREATILLGVVRQIEWRLRHPERSEGSPSA
jgi:TrmH family RNA methyltransferase